MNISTEPKEKTIRVRVTEEMDRFIKARSEEYGFTVSEYIRYMIQREMKKSRKNKKVEIWK